MGCISCNDGSRKEIYYSENGNPQLKYNNIYPNNKKEKSKNKKKNKKE